MEPAQLNVVHYGKDMLDNWTINRPVVQELGLYLTLDNPTDRALFQLGTLSSELRSTIRHHGPCRPRGPLAISTEREWQQAFSRKHARLPYTFWGYGDKTTNGSASHQT